MRIPRLLLAVVASVVVLVGLYLLAFRPTPATRPASIPNSREGKTLRVDKPEIAVTTTASSAPESTSRDNTTNVSSPAALLGRITSIKLSGNEPQAVRRLLVELERLRELGPAALPGLREFLASGQDTDYNTSFNKIGMSGGKMPADFVVPPSLRLALLEVVKNIGGAEAEALLASELKTTGRGVEAAYISSALQQIAPDKYRDASVAAARDLLAMPLSNATKSPLDRSEREYLYNILAAAGDRSQLTQAQSSLLLPDGTVDRGALRYLQQTMGEEAVAVALRAWEDPRVPANQREPLARVALNYVGTSERAEKFYQVAIDDPNLSPGARKNLIEDLNQDGFANPKKVTATDLPLIQKRLALIDQLAPRARDPVNIAAFAEAKKDLLAMRDKVVAPASTPKK